MPPQPPPLTLSAPKPNPKIIGRYKQKPKKVSPKFLVKKRGGNKGYVTILNPNYKAPAPKAPPPPPGPYDQYPDWAKNQLLQMDRDQQFHQSYVTDKVIPSVSTGLTNLNQFATTAADQYIAQLQGASRGASNVAAGATPMSVSGGPGGVVASPNAYQTQASSELSRSLGSAATAMGQHQAMLAKTSPAIQGQGILGNLAEYAKGLPLQYTTKRDERMAEIDQFLSEMAQSQAEFEEKQRHNQVTEAISATNAEANAAIAFGRLGLDSSKEAYDQVQDQTAAGAPVPYGYLPNPTGGAPLRDPTVPQATDGGSGGSGGGTEQGDKYTRSWFLEKGYKQVPAKAGAKWQNSAIASVDGSGKWVKGAGTTSTKKPAKKRSAFNLSEDLQKQWRPSDGEGVEYRFDNDPVGGGKWLAQWIRENKPSFIVSGRKADIAKLKQVLATVGGRPAKEALSILVRGYIDANGNWK
jgi:hypothetical protein